MRTGCAWKSCQKRSCFHRPERDSFCVLNLHGRFRKREKLCAKIPLGSVPGSISVLCPLASTSSSLGISYFVLCYLRLRLPDTDLGVLGFVPQITGALKSRQKRIKGRGAEDKAPGWSPQ